MPAVMFAGPAGEVVPVVGFLIGVIWPLVAMVFVGYLQPELSLAIGQRVPPGS